MVDSSQLSYDGLLLNFFRNIMIQTIKSISIVFCMSFCLSACSTMSSAYDSVTDTVGGWFKSDDAKK